MRLDTLTADLLDAEALLAQGDEQSVVGAAQFLGRLAHEAEHYVADHCPTTETVQWFSFPTFFERLAYRRVEADPRELRDVGAPLSRLYTDLAFALVQMGEMEMARDALAQAVRWNPMDCGVRIDLAEINLMLGDERQWLALSFSVFERASEAEHLVQAYKNFARYFHDASNPRAVAACLVAAERFGLEDEELAAMAEAMEGTPEDPSTITPEEVSEVLAQEGLPEGANAEIALTLIMCATDAQALGDANSAMELLMRARGLVGDEVCLALVDLIHEADEEIAANAGSDAESGEPRG